MTLPPRAIFVLTAVRGELLARAVQEAMQVPLQTSAKEEPPVPVSAMAKEKREVNVRARSSRKSNSVFQRGCRRREWWTPVH